MNNHNHNMINETQCSAKGKTCIEQSAEPSTIKYCI